jgi:hypothetical protein
VLQRLAQYILAEAEPSFTRAEAEEAAERLDQIASCNIREAFDQARAEQIQSLASSLRAVAGSSYADGRLAPHEWVLTPAGELFKTDCTGHAFDHTAVGPQSILWDVAGVTIEWRLDAGERSAFIQALDRAGLSAPLEALPLYELAYAAYRLGEAALCHELENDPGEKRRLLIAKEWLHRTLGRMLSRHSAVPLRVA